MAAIDCIDLLDECYGAEVVSDGAVGVAADNGIYVCALRLRDALAGAVPAGGGVGGVENVLAAAVIDVEAVAVGDEGEEMGAELAVRPIAIDDDVGEEGRGVHQLREEEEHGVGELNPLSTTVVHADAIAVAGSGTAHIEVGIDKGGVAVHRETVVFDEIFTSVLTTIKDEGVGEEGGVDVEHELDGGLRDVVAHLRDSEALGRVAKGETEEGGQRKGCEGVGAVANLEPAIDLGHDWVVDEGVHEVGAFGIEVKMIEAVAYAETKTVAAHAVGHVDVGVPAGMEQPRAAVGMEREDGVVVIGRERAGLIAAVEGEDAEAVLRSGAADFLRTEIGGAETAPDGVVVATRAAATDVVAHHIGVGARLPAKADALFEGIDRTEAKGTGRRGEVVLMIETHGVGKQRGAIRSDGLDIIVDRVGTDSSAEGVEEGGSRKSNDIMILLARILPIEGVMLYVWHLVPAKEADMGRDHRGGLDAERALRLRSDHEAEHERSKSEYLN